MRFITAKDAGEKWGISDWLGWTWAILEDAEKAKDGRLKSERKTT